MVVVESHHHVLKHWAEYRAQLDRAPRLFTLDHHTDTSAPFRTFLKMNDTQTTSALRKQWLAEMDFRKGETVEAVQLKLDHDEHIVAAIQTGVISSAFVIAQNARDTDLPTYREHKIMCAGVDRKSPSTGIVKSDCDVVLEDDFLNARISSFNSLLAVANESSLFEEPYILDIDLDYLNTLNSVLPQKASTLKKIAKNAGLITIAKESRHVRLCAFDENVTSEYLLPRLLELISN